jgi:rubredoxin
VTQYQTYMQALLWTCKNCGFLYEGGQPKQNCPSCESYKTSFVDLPQHIEAKVREAHAGLSPNHRQCRTMRLELMRTEGVLKSARFAGRMLPTVSGGNMSPSESM